MKKHKLILGTAQFGLKYGINNKTGILSVEKIFKILDYAYENKIRILDTAEVYGNAHNLIGEYHKKNNSNVFDVITKIPKGFKGKLEKRVEKYLNDLNLDSLHSLFFHSFEDFKSNYNIFKDMIILKKNKLFKNIGVSVYNENEINECLNYKDLDIIQMPFNLLDNSFVKGDIMKKVKSNGKTLHARSVFLQGLFFVDYLESKNLIVKKLNNELQIIKKIAKSANITIPELALNYCYSNKNIDNVVIGIDNLEHLKFNLNLLNNDISEELIKEIDRIKVSNINLLNPSLWN